MQEALTKTDLYATLANAKSEIIFALGTMAILQIVMVCFLVIYLA